MPFYFYEVTPEGREQRYHNRQTVVLAGSGLIRRAWQEYHGGRNGAWAVSAKEMLKVGGLPTNGAIVIDTAPSRLSVSLFEIKYVLGFTEGWAPLCLVLEQLFVDEVVGSDKDRFKESFLDGACERASVRTILYLKEDGNWGGNSRTTAALLWEETWKFFTEWKPDHLMLRER